MPVCLLQTHVAFPTLANLRACLVYRIFKVILKEPDSYSLKHCSSVWNEGFTSSFPKEKFLRRYILKERKNPLLALGFNSFTKSKAHAH